MHLPSQCNLIRTRQETYQFNQGECSSLIVSLNVVLVQYQIPLTFHIPVTNICSVPDTTNIPHSSSKHLLLVLESNCTSGPISLTEFNGKTNQPTKREHETEASSSATLSNGNIWFTSSKWRIAMSLLSLSAGVFFAVTANMYPLRCIHRLYFIQRSSAAQIHTYTPLGSVRKLQVPLNDITCTGDRSSARAQLALKVKDYPLFFLLDRQGMGPILMDAYFLWVPIVLILQHVLF